MVKSKLADCSYLREHPSQTRNEKKRLIRTHIDSTGFWPERGGQDGDQSGNLNLYDESLPNPQSLALAAQQRAVFGPEGTPFPFCLSE